MNAANRPAPHGRVLVQWDRSTIEVPLPPPSSPLSTLKATIFNITGVAPAHQKLIRNGAVLKDDLSTMETLGLVEEKEPEVGGSQQDAPKSFWESWSFSSSSDADKRRKKMKKLVLIGSKGGRVDDRPTFVPPVQRKEPEKIPDDEPTVVGKIKDIAGKSLEEWEPKIVELESFIARGGKAAEPTPTPTPTTTASAATPTPSLVPSEAHPDTPVDPAVAGTPNPRLPGLLNEVLLQSLLKLDAFEIPSTWTEARKERKEAVRKVQGALDRVDGLKDQFKALL